MGLYLSIPVLPGVRLGGRLTGHGPGLLVSTFIGMAKLVWWILLVELYLLAAVLAVYAAVLRLVWIVGRWAILTVANQPVLTPRDAIRLDRVRVTAWWRSRR